MSGAPDGRDTPETGSQLGTLRRLRLYARKPADAFTITSSAERQRDALLVFALYFLVRLPVVLQRSAALGRLDKLDATSVALALAVGLVGGVLVSFVLMLAFGGFLHVLVNVILRAGRSLAEAVRMPVLCLAPQLLLVAEFPSLVLDFRGYETFLVFLALRVVVDVLSLRAFYWGLRTLFGLSPRAAAGVTLLPIAAMAILALPVLLATLR